LAGTYANVTSVFSTPDEFTIDFARIALKSNLGIVVARIAMSGWTANGLAAQLGERLRGWSDGLFSDLGDEPNG
jgi:hypothetical protein